MRTGPLAYVVVGFLAVALVAVTVTVITTNQIADRKADKASLQSQIVQADAQARRFKSFADFAAVQQAREETVTTLAQSRFDWERVLRELAIVIPNDVWLTNVDAAVSGSTDSGTSQTPSSGSSAVSAASIVGPSLTIQGCADGHDAVAQFIAALHDIDGVTRVAVLSSNRPSASSGGTGSSSSTASTGGVGCSSRGLVTQFQVIAAFDAVQLGSTDSSAATPSAPTTTSTTTTSTTEASSSAPSASSAGAEGAQVAEVGHESGGSKGQRKGKGGKASNAFVPGAGSTP